MTYNTACDVESSLKKELPEKREIQNPAQRVVTPDIYARAPAVKKPEPKTVDQSLPNVDKSIGFDPYDTGILQQQKIKG